MKGIVMTRQGITEAPEHRPNVGVAHPDLESHHRVLLRLLGLAAVDHRIPVEFLRELDVEERRASVAFKRSCEILQS